MNTNRTARNRILSLALAVCLLLAMVVYLPGPVEVSAAPNGSAGDANDGVDFDDLLFYFGEYKHADSWNSSYWNGAASYESNPTPILWRVVGEENGNMVALSEYVLDSAVFNNSSNSRQNAYAVSDIKDWLNTFAGTGTGNFPDGEQNFPLQTTVYTRLYNYSTGAEVERTSAWGGDTYDSDGIAGTPVTQQFYLPWGTYGYNTTWSDNNHNKVGWDSGADKTSANVLANNTTTLKGGGSEIYYWLRSPYSNDFGTALFVRDNGLVRHIGVTDALGVRPAFQFNPSSVIFTSKIVNSADTAKGETEANGTDYSDAAGVGANFKLTILNTNVKLDSLSDTDRSLDGDGSETLTIAPGGTLDLTGSIGGGADNLVYKIVDRGTGGIVGYGAGNNTTDLTIRGVANVTDGNDLSTTGKYTLYVWAQDNNDDHSHEGSQPMWFPLDVRTPSTDATLATVAGETISDNGEQGTIANPKTAAISLGYSVEKIEVGNIDPNDTNATVKLYTDAGFSQNEDQPIDLDLGDPTDLYIKVTAEDGSELYYKITVTRDSEPKEPYVARNTLSLAEGETIALTISLGRGDSAAHSATITSEDDGVSTVNPARLEQSDDVSVTGVAAGKTTLTIGYSGGARDGKFDTVQVTVTAPDDGGNGNGDGGNGNGDGGNTGGSSGARSRSSSSGGSSTPDGQRAKTTIPANAFTWDGRTLTIDHDSVTPLGLQSVRWDNVPLTRGTDFAVYSGSVIIRFGEDFIARQSPGTHTVKVEFLNHTGEATVTVGDTGFIGLDDNEPHNPSTGGYPDGYSPTDNPNTGGGRSIWFALLLGSLGGAAIAMRVRGTVTR